MKYQILILSVLLLSSLTIAANLTTQQVVDIAEQQLDSLLAQSKNLYSRRCSSTCESKIFDECSNFAPELYCEQNFPFSTECSVSGAFMSWDHTAGRCPNGSSCDSDEDVEIACSQAGLFDLDEDGNSLRHDIDSPIAYQYVGFSNGFRMIYPYQHLPFDSNGYCQDYDPRYRPWYVGAATGAKNLVLIIDNSGSMDQEDRLANAKKAAIAVVETLGQQDWFAVVSFGTTANSPHTSLVRATTTTKNSAISYINNLGFNQLTNYEAAYQKAFDLIQATNNNEFGSQCGETMFLFLTDGLPTVGEGLVDTTLTGEAKQNEIDTQNPIFQQWLQDKITETGIEPNIFSYALGASSGEDFPKSMACENKGIFYKINDANSRTQLMSDMRSYYDYLASGLEINEAIWSEIYIDQITKKEFITAAKPIYAENSSQVQILLGVAGVDIDVATIKNSPDYDDVIYEIQSRQRKLCSGSQIDISECQLNSLRGENQCASDQECPSYEGGVTKCANALNKNPWVDAYPVDSSGKQIQYSEVELSSCCPDPNAVVDNSSSIIIKVSFILLSIILIFA